MGRMSCKPDSWAREWIEMQRLNDPEAVRGWTIEKRGNTHYIIWGSTVWDKEEHRYRKRSRYIGILNSNGTIAYARHRKENIGCAKRTRDDLKRQIIEILDAQGCLCAKELSKKLGYSKVTNLFRSCLVELIEKGDVVYTHPENPNDPRQMVCLNEKRRNRRLRSRNRRPCFTRSRSPPVCGR